MGLTLVILAAGMSSRYGGVLKQVDPVGPSGEVLMDYAIYDAVRAGFSHVTFIVRPEIEDAIASHMAHLPASIGQRYVYQRLDDVPAGYVVPADRVKPWGTGQALLAVETAVDGPFAVVNADDFYGPGAYRLLAADFARSRGTIPEFSLVGYVLRRTLSKHGAVSRGVCRTSPDGYVEELVEMKQIAETAEGIRGVSDAGEPRAFSGDEMASMNCWGFTPEIFPLMRRLFAAFLDRPQDGAGREFILSGALDEMVRRGEARLRVLPGQDQWIGMTSQQDKSEVRAAIEALIARGVYPTRLFN